MKKKNKKTILNVFKNFNYTKHISKAKDKFVDTLNLPRELTGNHSKITMIDNGELLIEAETSVLDCSEDYIKLKCLNLVLQIEGKNLKIEELNETEFLLSGIIHNISFENR